MSETIVRPLAASRPRNGLPEWRPYVYGGTGIDTLTPHLGDAWDDAWDELEPDAEPCGCTGSMYAYRQHLANGEDPCQESRDAVNAWHRERGRQKRANACRACGYKVGSPNHRALCGGAR